METNWQHLPPLNLKLRSAPSNGRLAYRHALDDTSAPSGDFKAGTIIFLQAVTTHNHSPNTNLGTGPHTEFQAHEANLGDLV